MNFNIENFVKTALGFKLNSIDVITVMDKYDYWYSVYEDDTMAENEYWLDFEDDSGDTVYFHFIDDVVVDWEF